MMVFKTGSDYTSPHKRKVLVQLAKNFCEKINNQYDKQEYCDRFLDQLIQCEQLHPGYGYTEAIEDQSGYVHCLVVAQLSENWWYNRCDVNVSALLINDKCNPKYPKVLLERLEHWGLKRGAGKIMLYSWNNRKGYHRAMERLGLNTHGYIYSREIQNEN